jgi:hypothetical protein
MDETLKAITIASQQTDRWLFMAALVLLMLFAWLVIKWLVNRTNKQNDVIVEIVKEQNATALKLVVVLERCISALDENSLQLNLSRNHNEKRLG